MSLRARAGAILPGQTVILILLGLLVVGGALAANMWKQELHVNEVRVDGARIIPVAEIERLASVRMGTPLFDVDLGAINDRVDRHPYIASVAAERDVPGRIVVRVRERVPVASLVADRYFYLDADGVVLPAVRSEQAFDLPVITGTVSAGPCVPGRRLVSPAVTEALTLLVVARAVSENLYRRISEVHIEQGGDLVLYTAEFGVPVLIGRGDLADKLARLESFWNGVVATRGAHELTSLDLRFAGQVVVRWSQDDVPQSH